MKKNEREKSMYYHETHRHPHLQRLISSFIIVTFIFSLIVPPVSVQAQQITSPSILNLPQPGSMVQVTPGFLPTIIKGIITHPDNPLEFDFIIDHGENRLTGEDFNEEARKQIKYFLAALTTPEEEMWVNLSPYEGERIIPTGLGLTEMGQDLLSQDYILKQLTASLMYPEEKLGSEFWNRVRAKAQALYGTTEIPMNTYNKIWIVPNQATVYQKGSSAFVLENQLKVMLEEDYVALTANLDNELYGFDQVDQEEAEAISEVTSQVIKEVLIPEIEYEVNHGKHFAKLRQIANAMVLATWYKQNLKESLLSYVYIDQNKTTGIDAADKEAKDKIYDQYIKAFEQGVYNYIKEDYDPRAQQVILRKYFSGGFDGIDLSKVVRTVDADLQPLTPREQGMVREQAVETSDNAVMVNINLIDAGPGADVKTINDLNTVANRSPLSMSLHRDRISLRTKAPATSDAAMLSGVNMPVPVQFNQFLRQQVGLTPSNFEVVTIKGQGEQAGILADNPAARYVLETASAAALGAFNLRGRGRYTENGLDIKTAADGNAVQMIEEETINFIFDNPGFALIELASEGKRDGSVSSPLGRIYNANLSDTGYIDTVKFTPDGKSVETFDLDLYKRTIDTLRTQGVQVYYKVTDALEKTEGLTDPAALNNPTDSWALSAVIGDVAQGKYLLPIDDNFRRAAISYNAPRPADIGPIDLPSVALPKIAEANGLVKGTPEYTDFMNQVTVVTLGPREIDLGKDSGNERHAAIIKDAVRFKQENGFDGMQVSPISDGDLMPRLIALTGPSELNNFRRIISFGRSGSAEAEAARAFAQQIPGARMVSRLVSTSATKNNVAYETAGQYNAEEIATAQKLGYTVEDLNTVTSDETLGIKAFVAMTAVTGATEHLGQGFRENMQRVNYNEAEQIVQTNTLFSDQAGNLFVVRTTYGSEDMQKSRASINRLTQKSANIFEEPTFQEGAAVTADEAMLADVNKAASLLQITPAGFAQVVASRIDRRKVLDDFAEAGGISPNETLDNLVKAGMAVKQGTNIYDFRLTDDFYTDAKMTSFRDFQVSSSQNPAATDLSVVRMQRIIYSGVDQNGLFSDLAPGQENQFVFRLNQARSLPLLTSAWKLQTAKKEAAAKPAQRETFDLQKFVDQSGINDFFQASGIQVEFSAPDRITVSTGVAQALTEYQQAYQADIAQGQFNYRGTGTSQTVSDYYTNDFKPKHYDQIRSYISQQFDGGRNLKTIVTNGIGANDQFMWALVEMYNRNRGESDPVWYHVTTARDLAKVEMNPATTLFIDISRSGSTWEGVQVANQTLANGFTKRIVLANGGVLKSLADSANSRDNGAAIQIGMQPDIGGRNMHRKTPIYYTAQTVVGMFVPAMDADNFARLHDEFDRMNDFANPASLAVNSAKFLDAMMELRGTDHVAFISNSKQTAILGTELGQYFMEGSNKEHVISYGEHNLSNPQLEPVSVLRNLAASKAGEKTFAIAVLDKSSPNFAEENARVEELKQRLPMVKFIVDSSEGEMQGLSQRQQAAFDIFTTDFITALTSLLRVDANSNPNVKVVRGLTATYVSQWKSTAQRYETDLIGSGQTNLLLSFGRPGTKEQSSVGTPEKQTAVNSVEDARQQGRALADQMASEEITDGRNRLNIFAGADEIDPFSKELRRDTFNSPLATQHGFITETGIYPLRAHKGHEATLAYRTPEEIAQGKAPLLANKSINIFLNQRVLGQDAFYTQPFQNVTGLTNYDNVNGANINQTNDSMTFPNIQRAAEVAPTILFEFETMSPEIREKITAFNQAFTSRLSEIYDTQQDSAVLSVQSQQNLEELSTIISQQLAARNVAEGNRVQEIRTALAYADANKTNRELNPDRTYPFEIESAPFFTSLSGQLGITPAELVQSLSGSTNPSVQKLAQEAALSFEPGSTGQLPAAITPEQLVARSSDNKRVLVRVESGMEVRDTTTGSRVSTLANIPAYEKAEFSGDSRRVKVSDQNGFSLYDVSTGIRLAKVENGSNIIGAANLDRPVLRANQGLALQGFDPTSRLRQIREQLQRRFEEMAELASTNVVFSFTEEELEAIATELNDLLQIKTQSEEDFTQVIMESLKNSDNDARRLRANGIEPDVYNVNAVTFITLLSSELGLTKSALVNLLTIPSNTLALRQLGASATRFQLNVFSEGYTLAVRNAEDIEIGELQTVVDGQTYEKLQESGARSLANILVSRNQLTDQYGVTAEEAAQIESAVNRFGYKLPDATQSTSITMTGEGLSYLVDEINMTMMAMNQNDVSRYGEIMRSLQAASAGQMEDLLVINNNYDINTVDLVRTLSREMGVSTDRIVDALTIPSNSDFLKHIGHVAAVNPGALAETGPAGSQALADAAQLGETDTDFTKGGIDLNPRLLDLQIKRDDGGIPLPVSQQPIEHMHVDGFLPVIINITPVTNLPLLLGLADDPGQDGGQISFYKPPAADRKEKISFEDSIQISLVK
ncbi:MAG: hypothetical protein AB7F70_13200 [Candidatus Omnitrophota bacterium]